MNQEMTGIAKDDMISSGKIDRQFYLRIFGVFVGIAALAWLLSCICFAINGGYRVYYLENYYYCIDVLIAFDRRRR